VHLMLEKGALGFIQKPYRIAALSQKIAEMLGSRTVGRKSGFPEADEEADIEKSEKLIVLPS
jgi:FixJ family two-component response regulator